MSVPAASAKPRLVTRIEQHARQRRHAFFLQLLQGVARPLSILDVGGLLEYWRGVDFRALGDVRVVLLNLPPAKAVPPPFTAVVGDACDLSRYGDGQFDVAFSNSVLGHVGDFEAQRRMAAEIRRVGRRYFVQTPNPGFPIDWRTLVPGFHRLPVEAQAWCLQRFPVGLYPRIVDAAGALELASRVRSVSRCELDVLFPGATVVPERFCGWPKSFMVFDGFGRRP